MLPDGREQGVLRGWIRSLACHYGSRALPLANPICYRLIGQITYYYRRFISHISPRLRPLVTSPLITGRWYACPYPAFLIASTCVVCLISGGKIYIYINTYRNCVKKENCVIRCFFSSFLSNFLIVTIDARSIRIVRFISGVCLIISRKRKARVLRPRRSGDDCFHKIKYL